MHLCKSESQILQVNERDSCNAVSILGHKTPSYQQTF